MAQGQQPPAPGRSHHWQSWIPALGRYFLTSKLMFLLQCFLQHQLGLRPPPRVPPDSECPEQEGDAWGICNVKTRKDLRKLISTLPVLQKQGLRPGAGSDCPGPNYGWESCVLPWRPRVLTLQPLYLWNVKSAPCLLEEVA